MKNYRPISSFSLLILLFALMINSTLQAQSTNKEAEKDQTHHELIKYEKTYTLEQQKSEEAFASTISGIERKSPESVFLAQNVILTDPSLLKKAPSDQPESNEEDYQYAYSGTFQSNDVNFTESSDDSNGGFAGQAGPGCGVVF